MGLNDEDAGEMVVVGVLFGLAKPKTAAMRAIGKALANDRTRHVAVALRESPRGDWLELEYRRARRTVTHGMAWRVLIHAARCDSPGRSIESRMADGIDVPIVIRPNNEVIAWLDELLRQPLPEWPGIVIGRTGAATTRLKWSRTDVAGLLDVIDDTCVPRALEAIAQSAAVDRAAGAILEPVSSLAKDAMQMMTLGKRAAEAGVSSLEHARRALAAHRYAAAVEHARAALAERVGRIEARLIVVEALAATDHDAARTAIDETLADWDAQDPRSVPADDWDRLLTLIDRVGAAAARARATRGRAKASAGGDFL